VPPLTAKPADSFRTSVPVPQNQDELMNARFAAAFSKSRVLAHIDSMKADPQRAELNSQLLMAGSKGDLAKIRSLLDKGADVNARNEHGWTVLMFAAVSGNKEMAKLLLSRKDVDVNAMAQDGWTALMLVAHNDRTEIARLLLARKELDLDATNNENKAALLLAEENGSTETAKLITAALIARKARR